MKSSTRKFGMVFVGVLVVMFFASFALAGPGGYGRGMMGKGAGGGQGMGPGQGNCSYTGSLTAEQSKEVQTLREGYIKEITPLQNQLFAKKTELRVLWSQANPDRAAVMAKQAELNELQRQLQEKNTTFQLEMRSIAGR
ncbi:MAG: hypothetical protein COZ70_01625 [Deltaproteobacteria bacterium CG_4_8_14_3_um_filter_51_11]|nr:periplasmic heavy metal sensor [bacterium]OIP43859.1 MAG: hypothetical protein AUK25_00255 [Desulfobacteraceae bacterium CG2_30_51_40]PIP45229.1 MAG: hypothetical protein COX16_14485 [Deltaproteobacteria bacterium CG23_combo_of_CG06-09_8_20_14_all_51_20]PIX20827.1 MAG: hypothetical protein COZ70_01625 [Deltaproteobacteria bacterium CG_4_8_14_3_um_filter_51_11]PJB37412.1 MAG: hypothetical protein CO107_04885 [Deltaproteobacteria bacterium CG_4_9_14_3_um_filter_51_14]